MQCLFILWLTVTEAVFCCYMLLLFSVSTCLENLEMSGNLTAVRENQ